MIVFQVYVNGKKVSSAGVGELGVLGAHVSWCRRKDDRAIRNRSKKMKEELQLHVGGLTIPARENIRWLDRSVKVGDEVRIVVVEDTTIDRPRARERFDPSNELRAQKKYVREMAKQFGWKIRI